MTDHREEHDNRVVDGEEKEALWLKARNAGLSRRTFLALLAAGGTAAVLAACGVSLTPTPSPPPPTPSLTAASLPPERVAGVVLPPVNAKVVPTACDYCVVGCAYKAYIWPVGTEGGPSASENALRTDFPVGALTGKWISPNMQNIVTIRGEPHHVLVIPDGDATVVNVGGDHSVRGGTLAQKLYNPNTPTRDRLQHPRLRIGDSMIDIPWDDARARGIESGDLLSIENDRVLTQTGGRARGSFEAVAYVTDQVRPGVTCGYFNFRQGRLDTAVNSVSPGQADPINNRYRYKLGKGRVTRIGVSDVKDKISFLPCNLI